MRLLLALGLLERGELALGQHQALLGDLRLEHALSRFFMVLSSWRCHTLRTPAGDQPNDTVCPIKC